MNNEELNSIKTDVPDEKDKVIISFNRFNGIDEIHDLDTKLFNCIPEEIGRYAANSGPTSGPTQNSS